MAKRYPEHDPARDGNRFEWIIEQSKQLRARRQAAAVIRQLFTEKDRREMAQHDAIVENDDCKRLKELRAQYNQARSRITR